MGHEVTRLTLAKARIQMAHAGLSGSGRLIAKRRGRHLHNSNQSELWGGT